MRAAWGKGLGIGALALLMGGLAAHAQTKPEAAETPSGGEIVRSVRIVDENGAVLSEAVAGIPMEAGKPLDRGAVAASLRALYRTGKYADLRAEVEPADGGVRLTFVASENYFFNVVKIEGLTAPPSEASASAAMQLGLGRTYRKTAIDEAVERLREVLRDEGLYQAEISVQTEPHAETHQMDVVVRVKSGPRAKAGAIALENGTEFRDAEIVARSGLKTGKPITSARLQKGTDKIRKYLVKLGHLSARATIRRGEYDAAKNEVPLHLDVSEGPRVEVAVSGAKFSKGELKRLIPIYQEGAVDTDLLEEGKKNLRERLERQGYFDATVVYTSETRETKQREAAQKDKTSDSTEEVITYHVERGERHNLVGIEIAGNHYFSAELLKSRLQIYGSALGARGRFSRRLVESDAASMKNLYLSNGFLDAKVDGQVLDNYAQKEGDLLVRYVVTEGKQTKVASVVIEGNRAFKQEELLGVIGSTPGQPYSDFGVTSDRDNILALYFNEGFPEASFSATAEPVQEGTNVSEKPSKAQKETKEEKDERKAQTAQAPPVRLTYKISEGPQTRVRNILVTGYQHTKPRVIRREVGVKPDAPLREGDVVESQRRLYNLGIFNRVTIEPQNPTGAEADKDIVVLVEEAKRYTVAYGGGFEVQRLASTTDPTGGQVQAAPRGILEVSKLNLTGRADTLSLKIRGSTIEDRALLGYSLPNVFGKESYSGQATAYTEKTQDINTFTEMRYEGSLQLTDRVSARTSLVYQYTFRKVLVSNLNIFSGEIPLFQQPTLVSQIGLAWLRDTRDNPAEASKGSYNSVEVSDADTHFGSSASFVRAVFQNSTYHPIKRRFSFARSIRFGILSPYRETVSLSFPAQVTTPLPTLIPLPERFFAGGGTSLRGFALNQAGPRDSTSGFPVGGQALLALNQEFRFPLRLPFVGSSLGGALFYDGGNVYSRLSRISFRSSLPKPTFTQTPNPANPAGPPISQCVTNCGNELNYFSHTIGFALRYATPVGPIRVDLGYQINRPFFVVPCTPITSNTKTAPNCFKGTQLPHFQIFFNLGSSF